MNGVRWEAELSEEGTPGFIKHRRECDQFMLGKNKPDNVCAQASCGEPAHQDIRVEKDSHDTDLSMSSSVR